MMRRRLARNQQDVLNYVAAVVSATAVEVRAAWPQLATSSAYEALRALRVAGLVEGAWDCTGAQPVRRYRVTAAGQARLDGGEHW